MPYAKTLAALADPTRRIVLERVIERARSVGELAADLPVSRPAVSQHLKVLKEAGLVQEEPVGARRIYRAEPAALGELRAYVDSMWRTVLERLGEATERGGEGGS